MRALTLLIVLSACSGTPSQPAVEPTPPPVPEPAAVQATQADNLTLEGAWARAVPPGSANTAVFFTANNAGAALLSITGATTTAAGAAELHTHVEEDGQMKMRQVQTLDVPGMGHLHLAPGGDHVMLIGLNGDLAEGSTVDVTLTLADGSTVDLKAPVLATAPATEAPHDHAEGGHDH